MADQIHPDLGNIALLYAIRDEALEIARTIPSNVLSVAYRALAYEAANIALILENQDLGRLYEVEKNRNLELARALNKIHQELEDTRKQLERREGPSEPPERGRDDKV